MITQGQQSQLKELLSLVEDYKNPPLDELIKTLNLPSWFNTDYCVIVMNKMHEKQFKGYEVDWMYFSDYIYFDQMIVMDKTVPYTSLATYPKGGIYMKDSNYEQYDGEVYTGNYQKELDTAFKKMSEEEQLKVWDKAIIEQSKLEKSE